MHAIFYYKVQPHVSAALCSHHQAELLRIKRKIYKITCLMGEMSSLQYFHIQGGSNMTGTNCV
jgi:hypothetical protein